MKPAYEPWIIRAARRGVPGWVLGLIIAAQADGYLAEDDE